MANQPMMFPGMGGLNPLAMMNPFMMQQMQQMAGGVDPRQSANGGGGQSAGANNDNSSSSSEEDEEVRRIHKETKKQRARLAAQMQVDRLSTAMADPDMIPRSCVLLRQLPLDACLYCERSLNHWFPLSRLNRTPCPTTKT